MTHRNHTLLQGLILILIAILLTCPLSLSVRAEETAPETPGEGQEGEVSDEHKLDEELAKTLIINEDPKSLNAEEREKGYALYYPMGTKYLVPEEIKACPNTKRRYKGYDNKEGDMIFYSIGHYFRCFAEIERSKDLYELEDKEEMERRFNEEVLAKDRPLFGVFVLKTDKLPEDLAELPEILGFEEIEKVQENEGKGLVTYFAWGKRDEEGLTEDELKNYQAIWDAIPAVRASCSFFTPAKANESFVAEVEKWDLKGVTLEGEAIDSSYFAKAKGTIAMYWATWCPDCAHQMDEFRKVEPIVKLEGLQFLGIVSDLMEDEPDEETMAAAYEKIEASKLDTERFTNIRYSLEMEDALFKRCYCWPTILVLDREGRLIKAYAMEAEAFEEDLLRDIADVIAYNKNLALQP